MCMMCQSPDWTEEVTQSQSRGGRQMALSNSDRYQDDFIENKEKQLF